MRDYLRTLSSRKPCILGGDLNCSFLDIDLHDPYMKGVHQLRGHTPEERHAFAQLLRETGFRDSLRHFYPGAHALTMLNIG
jgi:exonuclease III